MPVRYWVIWWASLGVAMVVFYVVLTPIWLGPPRGGLGRGFARRAARPVSRRAEERVDLGLSPEARDAEPRELGRVAVPRGRSCERVAEERVRATSASGATRGSRSRAPRAASTRRSVRHTRRGSQTRRGRSSQTTVSARSRTRSPSLPRYEPSTTHASRSTSGSTRRRSSAASSSVQPACQWIASSSTNGTPSVAASARPTVVFPHPLAVARIATALHALLRATKCRLRVGSAPCAWSTHSTRRPPAAGSCSAARGSGSRR